MHLHAQGQHILVDIEVRIVMRVVGILAPVSRPQKIENAGHLRGEIGKILAGRAGVANQTARFAQHLKAFYAELGVRGVITFIRDTCKSPWLDAQRIRDLIERPLRLRLQ